MNMSVESFIREALIKNDVNQLRSKAVLLKASSLCVETNEKRLTTVISLFKRFIPSKHRSSYRHFGLLLVSIFSLCVLSAFPCDYEYDRRAILLYLFISHFHSDSRDFDSLFMFVYVLFKKGCYYTFCCL